MRTSFAPLLSGLIVAIPTAIDFYLSSFLIGELFGGEIYLAVLFIMSMFFVFAKIFRVYK
ncbi:hypothetical protein D7Z94_06705 [Ulvibacterium marinum]|uniref:Uncharacterized protein n=1 Tax=Ulvibacterium marinum TaxID=2419782 RepID=A0A3B0CBP2_9FLAO|nr:hypothetical protein D7Z94_06705 [Ulvibacterium marinum]